MYGMVNKAIEDLVTSRFGPEAWVRVCRRVGLDTPVFIGTEGYPDSMTYELVGAVSAETGLPAQEVLHHFGIHWVLRTAQQGYGDLLDAAGDSLPEFLENLPAFHTRVTLILPDLRPPHFTVTDKADRSLRLHYRSHRAGLEHFVIGLLDGLGQRFGVQVSVVHDRKRSEGAEHDEFLVSWRELVRERT